MLLARAIASDYIVPSPNKAPGTRSVVVAPTLIFPQARFA